MQLDINDFVQTIGLLVVVVFLKSYFLWKILNIFVQSTWLSFYYQNNNEYFYLRQQNFQTLKISSHL
jgi:hypothetical protein